MRKPELTERDHEVIRALLAATVEGPFYPDWEFQTLFGFDRQEVREVLDRWPEGVGADPTDAVVYGAFNNLLGYPHDDWDAWSEYSDATQAEVKEVKRHYGWRPRDSLPSTGDKSPR